MNPLKRAAAFLFVLELTIALNFTQPGPRFRDDDPLRVDPDQIPIPVPESRRVSQILDFLRNTFAQRADPEKEPVVEAENINTLGLVPDSSWFTNRAGTRRLTLDELRRGPNQDPPKLPWHIVGVKTEGITPGFTIRDADETMYFIKFDPPGHPQLATSTEVIATKFFHAFGYNVPENHLVFIRRQDVTVAGGSEGVCDQNCELKGHHHERPVFVDEEDKERGLTEADVDDMFEGVFTGPDGRTPVVASRRLDGKPLGPFDYYRERGDDPNDIFPHRNRRELRGLKVFAAWLNHDDSRSINTLDLYVGDPGKGFVKHHLIDFGSCFGSGSVKAQSRRAGNEYMIEGAPIWKAGLSLGIWDRPWRGVRYPDYPSIGRFEADYFRPGLWKPEYPNPAFERMQLGDAFWAAQIVAEFSDEQVCALVETGELLDPGAEAYLTDTLIKRRDKILSHYLRRLNPLDRFEVAGGATGRTLQFRNLGVEKGLGSAPAYRYRWFRFDNQTRQETALGSEGRTDVTEVPIPDDAAPYLMIRIHTEDVAEPGWVRKVDVFLSREPELRVVGVERAGSEQLEL